MALWLLNPKTKRRAVRRRRRTNMVINKRRRTRRRNPRVRAHYRRTAHRGHARRRRRNPPVALFGMANPRRHRHGRRAVARRGRRRGFARRRGGGGFGLAGIGRILTPGFLGQVAGATLGLLAAIVLPNWLFGTSVWYTGWVKVGITAATAIIAVPMVVRFLPGGLGAGATIGALAAVGMRALGELTARPFAIGPGDVVQTPATLFTGYTGLGAYGPTRGILASRFGAYGPSADILPNKAGAFGSIFSSPII